MSCSAWAKRSLIVTCSCIAALAAFASNAASASTAFGDLNNFDVFNDTGTDCHGFEIELDDIHSTDITYTYDYNHYGTPTITEDNSDPAHPKVFVRYAAKFDAATSSFSAHTAIPSTPPSPTDGHQCTNPSVNFGCEHFGVGYYGAPTVIRYNWLVEDPIGAGQLDPRSGGQRVDALLDLLAARARPAGRTGSSGHPGAAAASGPGLRVR